MRKLLHHEMAIPLRVGVGLVLANLAILDVDFTLRKDQPHAYKLGLANVVSAQCYNRNYRSLRAH